MNHSSGAFELAATDLSNHLACKHLTQVNRMVALGEVSKPTWYDPSLEVLIKRGQEHEAAYIEHLGKTGLKVTNLKGKPLEASIEAMRSGAEVVVQARLDNGIWLGYSDILKKVDGQSKFGNWSYEVQDTKLAQDTRAATILQLCLYTDLLGAIQGTVPEKMYVVKPGAGFPAEEYRFAEFQAYYRMAKRNFEGVISGLAQSTYPEPVEHCSICRWWQVCDKKRHEDDYLSLVAGIRSGQIKELQSQDIATLQNFATKKEINKPKHGNHESLLRRQAQAKVQLDGRKENKLLYEFLPVEVGRGFNRLPEPNAGDVYIDFEGDIFYPDGGLEYILGYAYKEKGALTYRLHWATNRSEEKEAFIQLMEFLVERVKRFPGMNLYHFAAYEPSAIKRLTRVHAIFEKEVDEILRAERFIDLHKVLKEALLVSVETYSLKALEKLTRYTRKLDLRKASSARKTVEIALELGELKSVAQETLKAIALYNEDDCLATEALHDWLESLRNQLIKKGEVFHRPVPKPQEAGEKLRLQEIRSDALFKALISKLPEERATWTDAHAAMWLLANQLDYFRREDKSSWWEYFRVHEMDHEDLLEERKALVGLQFVEALPLKPRERSPVHRYSFPPQEVNLGVGDKLHAVKGDAIGTVESISLETGSIDIKKAGNAVDLHPFAVHEYEHFGAGTLWTSIMNLAEKIDETGLEHGLPHSASKDLLMKRKPQFLKGNKDAVLEPGESVSHGAIRLALNLDRSILPIQGPPGTGKTHTGAEMIIELVRAKKKVGVTAISHRVILTLLEKVKELSKKARVDVKFVYKAGKVDDPPEWILQARDTTKLLDAIGAGCVAGGTAWLWSEDACIDSLDYLFIDEAGQMSLSQALAASRAAKNIILLGDPQQLEQPQRGAHPEGSDVAALTYLLEGRPTMPAGKGLFIEATRRIHPAICAFTSAIFYEGKLKSMTGLEKQVITGGTSFDGAGLFYVPARHEGNGGRSMKEVEIAAKIVSVLLKKGRWINEKSKSRKLEVSDILIVAPYNAQVAALMEALPGKRIGTVDKFQGQEAPVVIYSMTASSTEDAPRGMGFLYNLNRLNVATSRARSICILVASPNLLEPECRTIEQMRMANALCSFREMAKVVSI